MFNLYSSYKNTGPIPHCEVISEVESVEKKRNTINSNSGQKSRRRQKDCIFSTVLDRMQGTTEAAAFGPAKAPLMGPELNLKCPRCESTNTKFCYYNNYNLSQPRHFCKDCRRYWTKGGSLRAVPVGGGTRKNSKRSSAAAASSSNPKRLSPASANAAAEEFPKPELLSVSFAPVEEDNRLHDISGSLLSSTAQFGSFFEFYHLLDSMPVLRDPGPQSSADGSGGNCGGALAQPPHQADSFVGDTSSWAGGWPDLSIYNPSSSSQ